jgi:hypothetical protein
VPSSVRKTPQARTKDFLRIKSPSDGRAAL